MSGNVGITLAELLARDAGEFLDLLAERLGAGVETDDEQDDRPRLYSVAQVAGLSGLSRWSIHESIRRGELGSLKVNARRLIPAEAFDAWIAERQRLTAEEAS